MKKRWIVPCIVKLDVLKTAGHGGQKWKGGTEAQGCSTLAHDKHAARSDCPS